MEFTGRKKISTELNITPLIDVVFQLLLFFMLSANFMNQPGIKLRLPEASVQETHDDRLIVTIDKEGRVYVDADLVEEKNLPEILRSRLASSAEKAVVIKGDSDANLGAAVRVMDMAKQASAESVVIATQKDEHVSE